MNDLEPQEQLQEDTELLLVYSEQKKIARERIQKNYFQWVQKKKEGTLKRLEPTYQELEGF
jgi:hypothetical protein